LRTLPARLLLLPLRALVASTLVVLAGRAGLARFARLLLRGSPRAGARARIRIGTGLQLLQLIGHVQLLTPGRARVRLRGGGGSVGHAGGAARVAVE
jgi:hypothetical protein